MLRSGSVHSEPCILFFLLAQGFLLYLVPATAAPTATPAKSLDSDGNPCRTKPLLPCSPPRTIDCCCGNQKTERLPTSIRLLLQSLSPFPPLPPGLFDSPTPATRLLLLTAAAPTATAETIGIQTEDDEPSNTPATTTTFNCTTTAIIQSHSSPVAVFCIRQIQTFLSPQDSRNSRRRPPNWHLQFPELAACSCPTASRAQRRLQLQAPIRAATRNSADCRPPVRWPISRRHRPAGKIALSPSPRTFVYSVANE
mgnify:CR=1 FL=1